MRALDRVVLAARRRARRQERERQLEALPGYSPERVGGLNVPWLRRGSVALVVACVAVAGALPGLGYAVASEVHDRGSEARYEAADRELERAAAAYEGARAVEMEASGETFSDDPVEAAEAYVSPQGETARALQGEMSVAAAQWSAAANER